MTRFNVGTVGLAAESPPHRTYDNTLGWMWWFKFPVYLHDIPDVAVTLSGQAIVSGAQLLFGAGGTRLRDRSHCDSPGPRETSTPWRVM